MKNDFVKLHPIRLAVETACTRRGLTLSAVAGDAGASRKTLCRIVRGEGKRRQRPPSVASPVGRGGHPVPAFPLRLPRWVRSPPLGGHRVPPLHELISQPSLSNVTCFGTLSLGTRAAAQPTGLACDGALATPLPRTKGYAKPALF